MHQKPRCKAGRHEPSAPDLEINKMKDPKYFNWRIEEKIDRGCPR
jgi:hypothetical protein